MEWAWECWRQPGNGAVVVRAEIAVTTEVGEPQPDFVCIVENGENRRRKTNMQAYLLKASSAFL